MPETFTDPFRYRPHPLVVMAAKSLIGRIRNSPELSEIFSEGKMLGVLAVAYGPGLSTIGYLAGFSGLAGGKSLVEGFVPPIFDLTVPDGYFKMKEAEISALNAEISRLSSSEKLHDLRKNMAQAAAAMEEEISRQKVRMAELKAKREAIRSEVADNSMTETLTRESQYEKAQLRRLKATWNETLKSIGTEIEKTEGMIADLKVRRKNMSDDLQEWIFRQYRVHDSHGHENSILDIFKDKGLVPPGGTGECAAPKLLEHAFRNGLKPLAMGEFWYGTSPDTAVRTEGHFYPSCTSKCGPLLGYMLQGMKLQKEEHVHGVPSIIYADNDIIAAYKPSGMPSVPGLTGGMSMLEWLVSATGCNGLESVHRLDMDTSGIMIFAKNQDAGNNIRKQFEQHDVRKTYKARLSPSAGCIQKGEIGHISLPLSADYDERPRQKVDFRQGKEATTEYVVEKTFEDGSTLVTFHPKTGRTHQLRVHSAHHLGIGRPIMGDLLYGGAIAPRLLLHAEEIRFRHPGTGEEVTFAIANTL